MTKREISILALLATGAAKGLLLANQHQNNCQCNACRITSSAMICTLGLAALSAFGEILPALEA